MLTLDPRQVETPAYVVDLGALERNLSILASVQERAECTILLALKGFAMWSTFPLARRYLRGVAASSPDEARLGHEEFGGQVHAYAPAYSPADVHALLAWVDHLIVNSPSQWAAIRPIVSAAERPPSCGIRVNPEHSEVRVALYDPCAPGSRLGATAAALADADLDGIEGLHFHTLCELGADALARTLPAVETKFGDLLSRVRWVNLGGGHHITRPDYDRDLLVRLVRELRDRHRVDVYLEPGEAIAIETGVLVASVLDVTENAGPIAILDTSATAHMPDVLEMPYRPRIVDAGAPGAKRYTYRLGGLTCLAGDVIGDYSFDRRLAVGDRLVFLDMAHYTMVKNTTFNGVRLPAIATWDPASRTLTVVRRFGYADYRDRLS
jgi:carboxyaminopropylagmatine decarboxylase